MSKKKLQVESIINELEGGASLFFSRPAKPATPPSMPTSASSPPDQPDLASAGTPVISENTENTEKQEDNTPKVIPNDGNNERTFDRSNERLISRSPERQKIRHTFDIFADQLMSLREISIEQEKLFGERVLLGDLVQQALDMFISKERNK